MFIIIPGIHKYHLQSSHAHDDASKSQNDVVVAAVVDDCNMLMETKISFFVCEYHTPSYCSGYDPNTLKHGLDLEYLVGCEDVAASTLEA